MANDAKSQPQAAQALQALQAAPQLNDDTTKKIQLALAKSLDEKLQERIIATLAHEFFITHNKTNPTNTITKDKAKQMVGGHFDLKAKQAQEQKQEQKQEQAKPDPLFTKTIERLIAYSTLADAGCLQETGDVNFNILQAKQAGDTSTYFARGKDSHEEGRFIARETILRHKLTEEDRANGKKYFIKTGKHGDSGKLVQGFLEEMLTKKEHSNIYDQQLNTWFSKSLIDPNNDNKVVLTAENFEKWCNQGEYGELVILNHIQGIKNPDQTLSEFLATANFESLGIDHKSDDTLNKKNNKKFNTHRAKLINKAINIDGVKGLQNFCDSYDTEDSQQTSSLTKAAAVAVDVKAAPDLAPADIKSTAKKYKEIHDLLKQDIARSLPLILNKDTNGNIKAYASNSFKDGEDSITLKATRLFSKSSERSAALRKPIAESLIADILLASSTTPASPASASSPAINNADEKTIDAVYQLALITDKDALDIAEMFGLKPALINQIENFKPPSDEVLALNKQLDALLKQDKKESKGADYNLDEISSKFSQNTEQNIHKKSFEHYLKNSIKELGSKDPLNNADKTKLKNYIYKLSILTQHKHKDLAEGLIPNNATRGSLDLQDNEITQGGNANNPSSPQ